MGHNSRFVTQTPPNPPGSAGIGASSDPVEWRAEVVPNSASEAGGRRRSPRRPTEADHFHGKEGVVGSSPIPGFIEGPADRLLSGADFGFEGLVTPWPDRGHGDGAPGAGRQLCCALCAGVPNRFRSTGVSRRSCSGCVRPWRETNTTTNSPARTSDTWLGIPARIYTCCSNWRRGLLADELLGAVLTLAHLAFEDYLGSTGGARRREWRKEELHCDKGRVRRGPAPGAYLEGHATPGGREKNERSVGNPAERGAPPHMGLAGRKRRHLSGGRESRLLI